jgi:hypothetical protein
MSSISPNRFPNGIVALLLVSLLLSAPVRGAVVDWLYEVDSPVADQSAGERNAAMQQALSVMLTRVTGLQDVPRNEQVEAALADPQQFVLQYRFVEKEPEPVEAPLAAAAEAPIVEDDPELQEFVEPIMLLRVRFSEPAVLRLVRQAGLPIWSANRPTVVIWAVTDDGLEREVLGVSSGHPLLTSIATRAVERGLPLVVPLMDLEDQLAVSPGAVWGGIAEVLRQASARYQADSILLARVSVSPTGRWFTDWQFMQRDTERAFLLEESSAETIAVAAVDLVADELVARYAVYSGRDDELEVQVEGVVDVGQYSAVLSYLSRLEFIEGVRVDEVGRGVVNLSLNTHTPWDQLVELLALDGYLVPRSGAVLATERVVLTWMGNEP